MHDIEIAATDVLNLGMMRVIGAMENTVALKPQMIIALTWDLFVQAVTGMLLETSGSRMVTAQGSEPIVNVGTTNSMRAAAGKPGLNNTILRMIQTRGNRGKVTRY